MTTNGGATLAFTSVPVFKTPPSEYTNINHLNGRTPSESETPIQSNHPSSLGHQPLSFSEVKSSSNLYLQSSCDHKFVDEFVSFKKRQSNSIAHSIVNDLGTPSTIASLGPLSSSFQQLTTDSSPLNQDSLSVEELLSQSAEESSRRSAIEAILSRAKSVLLSPPSDAPSPRSRSDGSSCDSLETPVTSIHDVVLEIGNLLIARQKCAEELLRLQTQLRSTLAHLVGQPLTHPQSTPHINGDAISNQATEVIPTSSSALEVENLVSNLTTETFSSGTRYTPTILSETAYSLSGSSHLGSVRSSIVSPTSALFSSVYQRGATRSKTLPSQPFESPFFNENRICDSVFAITDLDKERPLWRDLGLELEQQNGRSPRANAAADEPQTTENIENGISELFSPGCPKPEDSSSNWCTPPNTVKEPRSVAFALNEVAENLLYDSGTETNAASQHPGSPLTTDAAIEMARFYLPPQHSTSFSSNYSSTVGICNPLELVYSSGMTSDISRSSSVMINFSRDDCRARARTSPAVPNSTRMLLAELGMCLDSDGWGLTEDSIFPTAIPEDDCKILPQSTLNRNSVALETETSQSFSERSDNRRCAANYRTVKFRDAANDSSIISDEVENSIEFHKPKTCDFSALSGMNDTKIFFGPFMNCDEVIPTNGLISEYPFYETKSREQVDTVNRTGVKNVDNQGESRSPIELHEQGRCRPCAFFYNKRKGCVNGNECEFCHHNDHSRLTLKQWKKQKQRNSGAVYQNNNGSISMFNQHAIGQTNQAELLQFLMNTDIWEQFDLTQQNAEALTSGSVPMICPATSQRASPVMPKPTSDFIDSYIPPSEQEVIHPMGPTSNLYQLHQAQIEKTSPHSFNMLQEASLPLPLNLLGLQDFPPNLPPRSKNVPKPPSYRMHAGVPPPSPTYF